MIENKIKELRLERALTQGALASRINTTAATIQRLESGIRKLSIEWIERLGIGLECDPGEIIRRAENIPVIGHVDSASQVHWKSPTAEPEEIEAPPGIDTSRAAAIGPHPGQASSYLSGYYYFARGEGEGINRCVGRLSIVRLSDEATYLHVVMPSIKTGRWNLHGMMNLPKNDVEIDWAAPVDWIKPITALA